MKNKIITIILFLVLVVSIVGNVYQFNISKDINDNINCYTTELSGLNDNIDSLNNDITTKDNELATLSTKITELELSIQTVQTENDSLSAQVSELKSKKSELEKQEMENFDVESFEGDFIDAVVEDVLSDTQAKNNGTVEGRSTPEADALLEGKPVYDPNDPSQAIGESTFGQGDYSGLEGYRIQ